MRSLSDAVGSCFIQLRRRYRPVSQEPATRMTISSDSMALGEVFGGRASKTVAYRGGGGGESPRAALPNRAAKMQIVQR